MNQVTIGQRLNEAREAIGASLYQASQDTKIRVDFLESLEHDDFNFVSGGLYVRGMLRSYAKWLGIDDARVVHEFDTIYNTPVAETVITDMISKPVSVGPRPRRPQWLLAGAGAATILLVLSLIGLMNPGGNAATPPPNPTDTEADAAADPTQGPETLAQAPAPMQGVNVLVSVIGQKAWMEVHTDGNEDDAVFTGMLLSGQSQTFTGTDRVKMLIGDLGAVRLSLNGRDLGTPGQPGQVGTREFTVDSANVAGG